MRSNTISAGGLMAACALVLLSAIPAVAQPGAPPPPQPETPPEGTPPPELWMEPENAELAQLTADIFLLTRINEAGFTRDQVRRLIPVLERILRDADAMRNDVKRMMLEQRQLLLEGKQTADKTGAAGRELQEKAKAFAEKAQRSIEGLGTFLSPEQVKLLTNLVTARPGRFFMRSGGQPRMGHRPGDSRREREPSAERPGLHGPSTVILRRVVELLKEKLAVMQG